MSDIRTLELPKSELAASVDEFERESPQLKRHYRVRASLYREFYEALVERGFTEDQALSLTESEFLS